MRTHTAPVVVNVEQPREMADETIVPALERPDVADYDDSMFAPSPMDKPHSRNRARPTPSDDEARTQSGNATRLVELQRGRIRYVRGWKLWIAWKDQCWQRDEGAVILTELAKAVGRHWLRGAADALDDAREAMIKWGRTSLSASGISSMIELARGIDGVPIDHGELDANHTLFGVENGVIELPSGRLRNARPADLMTMQAPVSFDPKAPAPRWRQAQEEWFPNADTRVYVQKLAGAALMGKKRDHLFVIHNGGGGNGKSTFLKAFANALGPYARPIHLALIVHSRQSQHDTIKADLFRVRLAIASETEHRVSLAEASIKNLTGDDTITCRRMHENPWTFQPSHALWLQTNYLPEITGRDHGIWRRIKVVPWTKTFARTPDKTLDETLVAEAPGILAWAVEGCRLWDRDGLNEPEEVIRATLAYRKAEDVFARFASDCGLVYGVDAKGKSLSIPVSALNELLDDWIKTGGYKPSQKSGFAHWLREHGANADRTYDEQKNRVRIWRNIGLGTDGTSNSSSSLENHSHGKVIATAVPVVPEPEEPEFEGFE